MSASAGPVPVRFAQPAVADAALERPPVPWVDNILLFGLFSLLAFAILAFGAVEPWSTFTFEAGALVLFVIWALKQLVRTEFVLRGNPLFPAFAIIAGVVVLQLALEVSAYRAATVEQS